MLPDLLAPGDQPHRWRWSDGGKASDDWLGEVIEVELGVSELLAACLGPGGELVVYGAISRLPIQLSQEHLTTRGIRMRGFSLPRWSAEVGSARVAAELGLSEGNVRVIRHRGLQRLRDCVTGGAGARA